MDAFYHWVGWVVVWTAAGVTAFVVIYIILGLIHPIYLRTWLGYGIDAFRVWWAYDLKKEPLMPEQVEYIKRAIAKSKRYNPFKWWWLRFIDRHSQELEYKKAL